MKKKKSKIVYRIFFYNLNKSLNFRKIFWYLLLIVFIERNEIWLSINELAEHLYRSFIENRICQM